MGRLALCGAVAVLGAGVARAEDGGVDPGVVEEVLEERSGVLECYVDALGVDPYAAGHVDVTVTVGRYGKVVEAKVEDQCVGGERFRRCVERKLERVAFEPNTPQVTLRHEFLFNSGLIGHVIRGGGEDIEMCARSAPPPPGGHFTMAWQVRDGEIVGAEVVDASFEARALSTCIQVRSERWAWDFSKWTDGDVRYAFRFVEAGGASVAARTAATPAAAPAAIEEDAGFWGELRTGADFIRGNRVDETIPVSLSGGERWGDNELFGEATGQTNARWHAHVRYQRWFSDRSGLHVLVGARDDRFAGYDRRTQLEAGYSAWLIDTDAGTMGLDLGVEYAIEDYLGELEKNDWEGVLGLRLGLPFAWRIADRLTVYETLVAYQNVRNTDDRRIHNGAALRVLVARPLSLEVGHSLAVDLDPVRGKQLLDHAVVLGVVLNAGEPPPVRWLDPLP